MLIIFFKIIITAIVLTANYLLWKADQKQDIYLKVFVMIGLAVALFLEIFIGINWMGKAYVNILACSSLAIVLSGLFPLIQFFTKIAARFQRAVLKRMNVDPTTYYNAFLGLCYAGITTVQLISIWAGEMLLADR